MRRLISAAMLRLADLGDWLERQQQRRRARDAMRARHGDPPEVAAMRKALRNLDAYARTRRC